MGGSAQRSVRLSTFSLIVVAALLAAGCVEPSANTAKPTLTAADSDSAQGSIQALIVTPDFLPIEGAQVVLADTSFSIITGPDGLAVFQALDPGAYTVVAAKPGFTPKQARGRLVDVVAGELREVQLELEPAPVADAANTYHTTFPFTGFLSCTVQVYPSAAQTCGRQSVIADNNGKSDHVWKADSALAQTLVMEVKWQPTIGLLPFQLNFIAYRVRTCSTTSCNFGESLVAFKGPSPIYGMVREDATKNLTKRLSPDPTKFPRELYAETMVSCPPPSCYASVVVQQKYDAWITVFYGEQAPDKWSVLPK